MTRPRSQTGKGRDAARKRRDRALTRDAAQVAAREAAQATADGIRPRPVRHATPGTAAAERQRIAVRTVNEHLGAVTDIAVPGPGLAVEHGLTQTMYSKLDDGDVEATRAAIIGCGAADTVAARHNQNKKDLRVGRKQSISFLTVLTGLMLLAREGRPMLISELTNLLFERLHPPMKRLLEVRDPVLSPNLVDPVTRKRPRAPRVRRRDAQYGQVRRALHRTLDTIDPSIHPKNKVRKWADMANLNRDLTEEEQQELQAALDAVIAQLFTIPWQMLPPEVRAKFKGHVGIDGSVAPTFGRGKGINNTDASTDPDAGFYIRQKDHNEASCYDSSGKRIKGIRKSDYGYDMTMLVTADDNPGDRQFLPTIPLALSLDRPGCDPAGAARRVVAQFHHNGHTPGYIAGDALYPSLDLEGFHREILNAGFQPLIRLPQAMLGVSGSLNGMVHIEGAYYSPSIPDDLANANLDFAQKLISREVHATRIAERQKYAMRAHGYSTIDTLGGPRRLPTRWVCPAAGGVKSAIVACPNKPESMGARPTTRTPDGRKVDSRLTLTLTPDMRHAPPLPCRTATISTKPDDFLRYRQGLQYGSPEWQFTISRLRNSHEGIHGLAKDAALAAIAQAGRRRMRGLAASTLLIGMLVTAASIRRVAKFLDDSKDNLRADGERWVPRPPRKPREYPIHVEVSDDALGHDPDPPPGQGPPPAPPKSDA